MATVMATRKRKAAATILVADGAGGMRPVADHRFDAGAWTYQATIPALRASDWMAHISAVVESRGWFSSSLAQLDAAENSGSKTVHLCAAPETSVIEIAWEKSRRGDLHVKARAGGEPKPSTATVTEFLAQVDDRLRLGTRESAYRRWWLTYEGLPWRGELWLSDQLRLGPPSRFAAALNEPQIVLVDMIVNGIGSSGLQDAFVSQLRELALVLSPIIGQHFRVQLQSHKAWVPETDANNQFIDCRLQSLGYVELHHSASMPARGSAPALPLLDVTRPGLGRQGIWADDVCVKVPRDFPDLWAQFRALPAERSRQFLNACNAYSIARSMFPDQRTAYATFLVIACEALKPRNRQSDKANIYDVIATLIDRTTAQQLMDLPIKPQKVRSGHVHKAELVASEMSTYFGDDVFRDPSFDEMLMKLSGITRLALIEWLRRGGIDRINWMPRPKQKKRSVAKARGNTARRSK